MNETEFWAKLAEYKGQFEIVQTTCTGSGKQIRKISGHECPLQVIFSSASNSPDSIIEKMGLDLWHQYGSKIMDAADDPRAPWRSLLCRVLGIEEDQWLHANGVPGKP